MLIFIDIAASAAIAAILMALVILIGRLVDRFTHFLAKKLSKASGKNIALFIINRVMFIGTVFHELSHALFAVLTGAQVTKIKCFLLFSKEQLGYVNFIPQGGKVKQSVQKCLVSCAPVMTGLITIPIFIAAMLRQDLPIYANIFCGYCAISILCHMSMSKPDLDLYARGAVVTYPILTAIVLLIRYLLW